MEYGSLVFITYVSPLRNEVCPHLHIRQQKSPPTRSHSVKEVSWLIKRFHSPKATDQNENFRLFLQPWQSRPTAAWSRNVSQTHRKCQLNTLFAQLQYPWTLIPVNIFHPIIILNVITNVWWYHQHESFWSYQQKKPLSDLYYGVRSSKSMDDVLTMITIESVKWITRQIALNISEAFDNL